MGSVFKRVAKVVKKVTKPISKVTKGIAKGIAKVAKSVMKGVAKLNKKLGPIGMIAMSIAMPYAMQGLGGGVNWLMARPEGTFLNAVGKMGNNVRLGWQGFKQGFTAAKNSITKSITDTFSSMGKGNNMFKRISDGAKSLYNKAKELTPKFKQGKIGTVEVGGQQMSSQQAYEMVQKGMIDASQIGKQTLGQGQGFFTKAGNTYDNLITDVINETYADKIKMLDVNGTRHFNNLLETSKLARPGITPNHGEIFNHMTSGNGTVANYLDMTDDVISYTTDLAKTGDYRLVGPIENGTYVFNGNETFGKSLEPNMFTKAKDAVNKNKKTIINTGKSILKKSSDEPIIQPQEYPMVATNSGIGNEGTTAPLISSAAVTGSSGTDFFKKVYGNVAWNKLKGVANHMGFEGDNTYSTTV